MWEMGESIQVLPGCDWPLPPLFNMLCKRELPPLPEWSEMRLLLCFYSISTKMNPVCDYSSPCTINLWQQDCNWKGEGGSGTVFRQMNTKIGSTFLTGCLIWCHVCCYQNRVTHLLHLLYYCAFPRFPSTWKRWTIVIYFIVMKTHFLLPLGRHISVMWMDHLL